MNRLASILVEIYIFCDMMEQDCVYDVVSAPNGLVAIFVCRMSGGTPP